MRFRGGYVMTRISIFAAMAFVAGCATTPPADVEDRSFRSDVVPARPAPITTPDTSGEVAEYRVERGDTLYSIAFKRGIDYRDLASWNRIDAPYRIFVGQQLRLSSITSSATIAPTHESIPAGDGVVVTRAVPDTSKAATVTALNASTPPSASTTAPPPSRPSKPAPIVAVPPPVATTPAPTAPVEVAKASAETAPKIEAQAAVGNGAWRWPSPGSVIGTFIGGDQTRQGIDIAGKSGDPVFASADGDVVYSGNGLLGYGELIIIKHNANFLSAYGHNRKRLVAEGEKVHAGQQIAEMGSSASSRDELHFEIRKNGKPVNPMDYLPSR